MRYLSVFIYSTMIIHPQNVSRSLVYLIYMLMKCRTLTDYQVSLHELHLYEHIESRTIQPDMNNWFIKISSDNPGLSYGEKHLHRVESWSFTEHSAQGMLNIGYILNETNTDVRMYTCWIYSSRDLDTLLYKLELSYCMEITLVFIQSQQ